MKNTTKVSTSLRGIKKKVLSVALLNFNVLMEYDRLGENLYDMLCHLVTFNQLKDFRRVERIIGDRVKRTELSVEIYIYI